MEDPLISNDTTAAVPFHSNANERKENIAANDELPCPEVEMQEDDETCESAFTSIDASHNRFNKILKNISTPVFDNSLNAINPKRPVVTTSEHTLVSMPDNPVVPLSHSATAASASSHYTLDIIPQNLSVEQSKSRLSLKFLLKKSKRFCGAIRLYLTKPVSTSSSRLKSIMFSIKDSFKNTLASTGPTSKTISQITSSLVSTLKGQRLPDCLRLLGFSLTPISLRKKNKHDNGPILPLYQPGQADESKTFLNPVKKPELPSLEGFQFAKPKIYECSYCDTKFFKLPVYLKHIRHHAEIIRCESCGKAFSSVINKRRHRLQCRKKAIL